MKVRSFNFISQYLSDYYIDLIKEYLVYKGKSPYQPYKWTGENKKLPKFIKKYKNVNETVWILIRYDGAFDRLSITEESYEHDLRDEYQRAIAINFTDEDVSWEMFKTRKENHVKYMKTYGIIRD